MLVYLLTQLGRNPIDNNADADLLRAGWWHLFADPPPGSGYVDYAKEARTVTQQRKKSVQDREQFRLAMCEALSAAPPAQGRAHKAGGVAHPSLSAGVLVAGATMPPGMSPMLVDLQTVAAYVANTNRPPPGPTYGCIKCPLRRDGTQVVHPKGTNCSVVCVCSVCKANTHNVDFCFIKNGVPDAIRFSRAEYKVEMVRLHEL